MAIAALPFIFFQMHESGKSVGCFTLEGHIARLEIMGSKAIQVLQKTLHPITE